MPWWSRVILSLILGGAAHVAAAPDIPVQDRRAAQYPEGIAAIDGTIWYAEMGANVITSWRRERASSYAMPPKCGPTAVEAYGTSLVVLCHMSDELLLVNSNGTILHRQHYSSAGELLYNPNDAVRDDAGGVYFTSSGKFADGARAEGKIFYLHKNGRVERVANGLYYANGLDFDHGHRRLLVAEHFGRRVLSYDVHGPGQLGQRRVLQELGDYLAPAHDWMVGPDGLHLGADGTLRVAIYALGQILTFSPDGRMGRIDLPMRYATTVLHDTRRGLFVGGTFDINAPGLPGEMLVIAPGSASYGAKVRAK